MLTGRARSRRDADAVNAGNDVPEHELPEAATTLFCLPDGAQYRTGCHEECSLGPCRLWGCVCLITLYWATPISSQILLTMHLSSVKPAGMEDTPHISYSGFMEKTEDAPAEHAQ